MKIGTNQACLIIERTVDSDFPYFTIFSKIESSAGGFSGSNNAVLFGGGAEGRERLKSFHELDVQEVFLGFTEDCWVELLRHARGNLTIKFQISNFVDHGNTVNGGIEIDGDYAQETSFQFCRLLDEDTL